MRQPTMRSGWIFRVSCNLGSPMFWGLMLAAFGVLGTLDGLPTARAEEPAVKVQIVDKTGFESEIARHAGKVVLVDFWATWCAPCLRQLPQTLAMQDKYGEQGLVIVTVSLDDPEDQADVAKFLRARQAKSVNLQSKFGAESEAFTAFGIEKETIPHYQLYDRRGKLAKKISPDAKFEHEQLDVEVRQLLAQ